MRIVALLLAVIFFSVATLRRTCGQGSSLPSVGGQTIIGPTNTTSLPTSGGVVQGFRCQIEISQWDIAGYVPVRITVTAVGSFVADRRLLVRFATEPGGQTPPRGGLVVDVPITARQGSTSEVFMRYLPKWSAGHAVEVKVFENGRELADYNDVVGKLLPRGKPPSPQLVQAEKVANIVLIDDQLPHDGEEASSEQTRRALGSSFRDLGVDLTKSTIRTGQMPDDWRGYQQYDVVMIDAATLDQASNNVSTLSALRHWLLLGGTLVVISTKPPASSLEAIGLKWTSDIDSAARIRQIVTENLDGWKVHAATNQEELLRVQEYIAIVSKAPKPDFRTQSNIPERIWSNLNLESAKDLEAILKKIIESRKRAALINLTQWNQQIWCQPAGAGQVIGVATTDSVAIPMEHWQIVTSLLSHRVSPTLRRGVDPILGDNRFGRWLIPGVAEPPVYTFMGLLTAFVVLVGPIAYRRTAKAGRSYLMFAIAPALALVTTLAMFGYGVVADGFETVARIRQLTFVDGASGDAGERIRGTYFAGVRPGDGLSFPGNAEVIAYPESRNKSWAEQHQYAPDMIGRVVITDDEQRFDSSFLPSRQQRQFVVHQPRSEFGFLELVDGAGQQPALIRSSFDVDLHRCIVRDKRGNYWVAESVPAGQSVPCLPLAPKLISKQLGNMYNDHRPIASSTTTRSRQNRAYNNQIYDLVNEIDQWVERNTVSTDGSFETWLQSQLQSKGDIPRAHFVAMADISPDVLAVRQAKPVHGVRYIYGTLK